MKVQNPGIIYRHQSAAFEELISTAQAFADESWWDLPVLPRWHGILIGPTGSGKTHLVRAAAKALNWPILTIWTTRWIIAGGRGTETWQEIAQWLSRQDGKCLIFLDEIDKVSGIETWSRHLQTELYQLLDRDLPSEVSINDNDSEYSQPTLWAKAQKVLRCDAMIVGAGAFQSIWDYRPKNLGFGEGSADQVPTPQEYKQVLPAELINRFAKTLALPPLAERDYLDMIDQSADTLPAPLQKVFLRIAKEDLSDAINEGKGSRFIEECLTAALIACSRTTRALRVESLSP